MIPTGWGSPPNLCHGALHFVKDAPRYAFNFVAVAAAAVAAFLLLVVGGGVVAVVVVGLGRQCLVEPTAGLPKPPRCCCRTSTKLSVRSRKVGKKICTS